MKFGWSRILGVLVAVAAALPCAAGASEPSSGGFSLATRLDNALERLGPERSAGRQTQYEAVQPAEVTGRPDPSDHGEYLADGWDDVPAPTRSSGDWIDNGCWFAHGDFTVLHRTRADSTILGVDNSLGRILTTRDEDLGLAPGARITLGRYLPRDEHNRDRSVEFTFFGLNAWDAVDGLASPVVGGITTPLPDIFGGFQNADVYETEYHSSFNSFEINYRLGRRLGRDQLVLQPDGCWQRECKPGPTHAGLAGLRLVKLQEDFHWSSRRGGVDVTDFGGDYFVHTENTLLGVQLGLECLDQYCDWSWGARGKGGVYANYSSADIQVFEVGQQGTGNANLTQSEPIPALLGEISLFARYQLTPNCSLRGQYDLLFFQGLALAPEQVTFDVFSPEPRIINDGWVVIQGLSLGLEFVW